MLQLQYVYPCIAYRKNTVLLVTAFFGIPFITIGSEAYNAMSIGIRATSAARPELASPEGLIRGIALSASVFTMLVHTLSRKGGLLLINLLAIIKIGILLSIIALAISYSSGAIGPSPSNIAAFQANNVLVLGAGSNMTRHKCHLRISGCKIRFAGRRAAPLDTLQQSSMLYSPSRGLSRQITCWAKSASRTKSCRLALGSLLDWYAFSTSPSTSAIGPSSPEK
jgi:hypothetical protein